MEERNDKLSKVLFLSIFTLLSFFSCKLIDEILELKWLTLGSLNLDWWKEKKLFFSTDFEGKVIEFKSKSLLIKLVLRIWKNSNFSFSSLFLSLISINLLKKFLLLIFLTLKLLEDEVI